MTDHEYLEKIIDSQKLAEDSDELKALRARRDEVEGHLRDEFGSSPTIRYGGSQAKKTLIKDSYDLDLVCYFPRDDEDAGETLEEIYENVKNTLSKHYIVEPKTSALRVKGLDYTDFHVDVVPGRFIDEETSDCFLYRASGDKSRLKTNIETHIKHVKDSGVAPEVKLMKLWRTRHNVPLKTFIIELITVEVLADTSGTLDQQLQTLFEKLRDDAAGIKVEDPANPTGNDLSELWNDSVRATVSAMARSTLTTVENSGWEAVFGKLPEEKATKSTVDRLRSAARSVAVPARPWRRS